MLVAHVCLHISRLMLLLKQRAKCVLRLEHELAVLAIHGKRPQKIRMKQSFRRTGRNTSEQIEFDAIDHDTNILNALNERIDEQISMIERRQLSDLVESISSERDALISDAFREPERIVAIVDREAEEKTPTLALMEAESNLSTTTTSASLAKKSSFSDAPMLAAKRDKAESNQKIK